MDRDAADAIAAWITGAGLLGVGEGDLLRKFCDRMRTEGLGLTRATMIVDTLHPVHEGHAFRWRSDKSGESEVLEYGRSTVNGQVAEAWRRSPFFHMLETGQSRMSRRIGPDQPADFPIIEDLRADGQTGWIALVHRFKPETAIGELDSILSSWVTDEPAGFVDEDVALLERLVPVLALAVKSASLARIAANLVQTYLGRDAGRRVLSGRIERGVADRIDAALWFSDLRGYTGLSGRARPEEIIPLLNDYAEAVISAVHEAGGDVLKLIGDGTLAIFTSESTAQACSCALKAEALARRNVKALNERREAAELPVTRVYLGLHVGEVFYGNVGSQDRLDFTVVGPAVNEASRIAAMCRSAERDVLVSTAFRAAADEAGRGRLVSVGRYALRGIEAPQELFTVERS